MNIGIFCFSRTGNTKRFAQAIADTTKAPLYDMASAQPSETQQFDLIFIGTPVEGASPTKEALAFVQAMPNVSGKKAILFVTYRLFGNKRTMKTLEKQLTEKGYKTVLMVSKKGMKPENPDVDFSEALAEIKAALEKI
jgi:flavodoxin